MTIESQAQRATFSPFKGDVNSTVLTFSFATSVSLAVPIISGFSIGFYGFGSPPRTAADRAE